MNGLTKNVHTSAEMIDTYIGHWIDNFVLVFEKILTKWKWKNNAIDLSLHEDVENIPRFSEQNVTTHVNIKDLNISELISHPKYRRHIARNTENDTHGRVFCISDPSCALDRAKRCGKWNINAHWLLNLMMWACLSQKTYHELSSCIGRNSPKHNQTSLRTDASFKTWVRSMVQCVSETARHNVIALGYLKKKPRKGTKGSRPTIDIGTQLKCALALFGSIPSVSKFYSALGCSPSHFSVFGRQKSKAFVDFDPKLVMATSIIAWRFISHGIVIEIESTDKEEEQGRGRSVYNYDTFSTLWFTPSQGWEQKMKDLGNDMERASASFRPPTSIVVLVTLALASTMKDYFPLRQIDEEEDRVIEALFMAGLKGDESLPAGFLTHRKLTLASHL